MKFIDLGAQQARVRDRVDSAIAEVLDHGRYIMGPEVAEFEVALANFCGAAHVVGVGSGTEALLMSLMARGVGRGDAVFVPAFTFAATAEVVALLGATPVFVDVNLATYNIDPRSLADAFRSLPSGLRPVGVIPVDLFGLPADYHGVDQVAHSLGMWVVADAAQSCGAAVRTGRVGTFEPLTAMSFFPAKPLGCYGDGGAIVCATGEDAALLRSIRAHGSGEHKYDTVRLGINGRLDTIQAAVLLVKLDIFVDELERRRRCADRYLQLLSGVVALPEVPSDRQSAWAQFTIRVPQRDRVAAQMGELGVPTAVYYPRGLHQQPAFRHAVTPVNLPATELLANEVLSLPMHPYLTETDQDQVVDAVRRSTEALC